MQKQDQQCFYIKKVMLWCLFLFFSLGGQVFSLLGSGEDQGLNERRLDIPPTLLILSQNGRRETTDEQVNQIFHGCYLNHEPQTFLINENSTAEITSSFLRQSWVVEEENGQETNKIENIIQNNGECEICHRKFNKMKSKRIFVYNCDQKYEPHMFCYNECYMPWCQENQKHSREDSCPLCRRRPGPRIIEDISKKDKIKQLKDSGNINYIERNQQEPSHWKLYLRNKYYDNNIRYKTKINPENWLIVDGALSDMEVLETNLNDPKDLKEDHIEIIQGLKFPKVKFNEDQEPREFYLIFRSKKLLKILHNGSVLFNESEYPAADQQTEVMIKNRDFKGDILSRVICRYIHKRIDRGNSNHNHIFVFNKENIEYLKETKGLVIFNNNLNNVFIGLEGNEIISKEDFEEVFETNEQIGLVCDNVNNFKAMKTNEYFLLSPIDLSKINHINDMRKDTNTIPIAHNNLDLTGENCFLLPLFEFNSIRTISLRIDCEMAEREIVPHKNLLESLKEMFVGVKIEGEETYLMLVEYAIVFLLYFDENALNVSEIFFLVQGIEYNDIWDELTREGGPVLTNQTVKKQNVKLLNLMGECLDFAINTKLMENVNCQELTMESQKKYTNDNFISNKDRSIMSNGLKKLTLILKAIKYLLYFKGINKLEKLKIFIFDLASEENLWVSGIMKQVGNKNIRFLLPTENCLTVFGFNIEQISQELKKETILFGEPALLN